VLPEQYPEIIRRVSEGERQKDIAADYGCSQPLISWIMSRHALLPALSASNELMTDHIVQLVGGPCDGQVLPNRYWNAARIQMPVRDPAGFATYVKDSEDPTRFLFEGFSE